MTQLEVIGKHQYLLVEARGLDVIVLGEFGA